MVARVMLHNMCQDRDEPIRAYGGGLHGQSREFKLTTPWENCEADVDI